MKTISFGKYRCLSQVATSSFSFSILALDHRNNLRHAINPGNPEAVTDVDLSTFKSEVVTHVGPMASSILLDPEVGAFQSIANGSLPGDKGLICAIEETGYTGDPTARKSQVLPGWSVAKAKKMGASAVKLLVYYHPKSQFASQIEQLILEVAAECESKEIPLFLEPLSYSLIKGEKLSQPERQWVVIETARRLTNLGADILKAEFPIDVSMDQNERSWFETCEELSVASKIPWVLLSASVDYDTYLHQVEIACQAGCSGVAAGRAVWKEAVTGTTEARMDFLSTTARYRMKKLTEVCTTYGKSWKEFYTTLTPSASFYQKY